MTEKKDTQELQNQEKENSILLAANTLTGDVRDFIIDRVKNLGKPWAAMSEDEQREQIYQAKEAAEHLVREACVIIAAGGKKAMTGKFVKASIKDKIQCQIDFGLADEQRHELFDTVGMSVCLVLADAAPFTGEKGPAEPTPDQSDLLGNAKKVKEGSGKVTSLKPA